ncbi:hypothetical protein RB195_010314 [Necator americanus]|uniref:Thiamin pyrophosphokinase catalytic domain-containing protein n=1 Tax=Necator americanus TaxID=51031 RepID=A0ABR1CYT2_NECAM
MERHLSPLDCILRPGWCLENNVCVWLNGAPEAERPIWVKLWNTAQRRYCTDGGANRIMARNQELSFPDVVVGDMDSILTTVTENLRHRSLLIHTPDQDKTDLTKCLEYIAEDFNRDVQRLMWFC